MATITRIHTSKTARQAARATRLLDERVADLEMQVDMLASLLEEVAAGQKDLRGTVRGLLRRLGRERRQRRAGEE